MNRQCLRSQNKMHVTFSLFNIAAVAWLWFPLRKLRGSPSLYPEKSEMFKFCNNLLVYRMNGVQFRDTAEIAGMLHVMLGISFAYISKLVCTFSNNWKMIVYLTPHQINICLLITHVEVLCMYTSTRHTRVRSLFRAISFAWIAIIFAWESGQCPTVSS